MNIKLDWVNTDKSMLCCSFPRHWTWDDMDDFFQYSYNLLDTLLHPVPVLIDFQNGMYLPKDAVMHFRSYMLYLHPHANPVILVGINSSFKSVLDFFYLMIPSLRKRIRIANSLTEALLLAQAATLIENASA